MLLIITLELVPYSSDLERDTEVQLGFTVFLFTVWPAGFQRMLACSSAEMLGPCYVI